MKRLIKAYDPNGIKTLMPFCIVSIFYFIAFHMIEKRNVPVHIIQGKIDNLIPFCEYFIVPYLLWFVYVAVTVLYFACFNREKEEYKQLCFTLLSGMIAFLVISYFYPNGQNLRPALNGDNIFERLVMNLYATDTSTNILPSLHVFYSVACCIALVRNHRVKRNKAITIFTYILTISIVLATMFLKQHSIIDVVMALTMNGVCFYLFYENAVPSWKDSKSQIRSGHKRKGISL